METETPGLEAWVVEGDDGEVVDIDPTTGKAWTQGNAEGRVIWAGLHGQTIHAYPADSIQGVRHDCLDCHAMAGRRCEPECSTYWV